ncbi:MAG: hypothetical protein LBJ37_08950 [Paucimonas sp.]|jgi:hypothetical protein|nr:hypothetical protein [Paucimonas sp.]
MSKEDTPAANERWVLEPDEVRQRMIATFQGILGRLDAATERERLVLYGNAVGLLIALRLAGLVDDEEHRRLEVSLVESMRPMQSSCVH